MNRLEKIDDGRLYVHGELLGYSERKGRLYEHKDRALCAQRSEIGMVFQFMDGGVVKESGHPIEVLERPQHERTQAFLSKVL
jgi:ABC-type polar amino acid transport system ATPase subunit